MLHTAGEYVNKDGYTTNNVENFFGVFKKGMVGTYHFCGEQHLQRYLERIFVPLLKPFRPWHWRRGACGDSRLRASKASA